MKMQPKMWPARGERTAKAKKSMGKTPPPASLGMKSGGKMKPKAKGLPVGKSENDMSASKKMMAMKGKPGKFKPGSKDKPSFVRG